MKISEEMLDKVVESLHESELTLNEETGEAFCISMIDGEYYKIWLKQESSKECNDGSGHIESSFKFLKFDKLENIYN